MKKETGAFEGRGPGTSVDPPEKWSGRVLDAKGRDVSEVCTAKPGKLRNLQERNYWDSIQASVDFLFVDIP